MTPLSLSTTVLRDMTGFIYIRQRGVCPPEMRHILSGGSLIALTKESEDLRPIAVGYTLMRRVDAKCANRHAVRKLTFFLTLLQVGIATPAEYEAVVHAARKRVIAIPQVHVFVKLDFSDTYLIAEMLCFSVPKL